MHSFQPSRGRTMFDFLCAIALSASFAGAWLQTQASALLGAAGVAALYGLVRLFDLRRGRPAEAAQPQRIEFEPEANVVVPMIAEEPAALAEEPSATDSVEPAAARASSGRRSGSRKGAGRRAKAPKAAKAKPQVPDDEAMVPWPMAEEAEHTDLEAAHPHIAPLFEPDPFVRMPRQAFGRRGQI